MTGNRASLVQISDVLGLGKIADSKAVDRLAEAIVSGVGRLLGPWLLKREFRTQIELQEIAEKSIGSRFEAELELADRSRLVLRTRELVEQQNRERISVRAIEEFATLALKDVSGTIEVEPDWLSQFWRYAESVSSHKMQEIWGRILAREAASPGTTGIRTLEVLRSLSYDEAIEIQRLSGFVFRLVEHDGNIRPHNVGFCKSLRNKYVPKPLREADRKKINQQLAEFCKSEFFEVLGSAGFWSLDAWGRDFHIVTKSSETLILVGDTELNVSGFVDPPKESHEWMSVGSGLGVSVVAAEIFALANTPADETYCRVLTDAFRQMGLTVSVKER